MKVHVFYGAQYMGDESSLDEIKKLNDGAFIKMNGNWYTLFHGSLTPVNKTDLPPMVLAQLALLGETK
jgi:hypothetical protein